MKKKLTGKPGSCIIYTPNYSQQYYNEKKGFINDWFHFSGEDTDTFFDELVLPLNTIFHMTDFSFIRVFIKKLEKEFIRKELFWEENTSALLRNYFIELARENNYQNSYKQDPHNTSLLENFKVAREAILTNLEAPWTIEEMASLVSLSRSRFSILYKNFFQCSPKEELIKARISKAQYLLVSSRSPVKEVALKVGYENTYHFSKQFKNMTGYAPGKYAAIFRQNNYLE